MAEHLDMEEVVAHPQRCEAMEDNTQIGQPERCPFTAMWKTEQGSLYCNEHKDLDDE